MKKVLMVAYHFPPLAGSSGIQRTLRFAQHLPEFGWEPIVLTAHPRAYERTSDDLLREVPERLIVKRAFALDTARHLSLGGRYPGLLATPDRWMTWRFGAVARRTRADSRHAPQVIWSTYPIATAHVIGSALSRRSGLPWIADFRDPMAQEGYPDDPAVWKSFKAIEERAVAEARFSTFTTPGAAREYRQRYPAAADRIRVLENGFDEESFAGLCVRDDARAPARPARSRSCTAASCIPPSAIRRSSSRRSRKWSTGASCDRGEFMVRFRAAGHDDLLRALAQRYRRRGVRRAAAADPVSRRAGRNAARGRPARAAGVELQRADSGEALRIPARRRPIVALTDPGGDTAGVVRAAGLDTIARLDSVTTSSRCSADSSRPCGRDRRACPRRTMWPPRRGAGVPGSSRRCSTRRWFRTEHEAPDCFPGLH